MRARGTSASKRKLTSPRYFAAGLLAAVLLSGCARETRPLNVVFILADDLGYMDVGFNHPETFYETPHLDRLAAESLRFTQAYAASPVCSPTRYSLLTGRHPARVAATDWFGGRRAETFRPAASADRMELDELTLAEVLRERGYETFFAGKWHLGGDEALWPEHQGFRVNKGGHKLGGPYGGDRYFSPYGNPRLEDGPAGEHLPDRLARETASFLRENQDRPFFAMLSFYSVHTPLMAPSGLVEKYEVKRRALGEAGDDFGDEEQVWPTEEPRRVRRVQNHAVYAAMVEAMDAAVGTVLAALEETDLMGRTIVVFFSDNGGLSTSEGSPTSNTPLRGGKGWLYEGGIRVPALLYAPGTAPRAVHEPIVSMDFFPTLLAMTASEVPALDEEDGTSLVPLMDGGTTDRDALFWHYPHYSNQGGFPGAAVRQGDLKLIERFKNGRVQLYDVSADPEESRDLSQERPEDVARLRAKLHNWYEEVGARFLRPHPGGEEPWRPENENSEASR